MIVVFGAGGFIGTYLVDALLENGYEVVAVDIDDIAGEYYTSKNCKNLSFQKLDITDDTAFSALSQEGVEAVVNVACLQPVNVSSDNYSAVDYIKVNVIGALNILEFCKVAQVPKLVYAISHRGVQGVWAKGEVVTEESVRVLKYTGDYSMFSISEAAAQDCIEHYAQEYGIKSVVLRLPPVCGYGPHLEGYTDGRPLKSGFMSFIEHAKEGSPIELWGDVARARSIVYVKDVVSAILLAVRSRDARGLYNIAMAKPVSLKDEADAIIRTFSNATNRSVITFKDDKPNSIELFSYDISKARKELQWQPNYDLLLMTSDIADEMRSERFKFLIEKRRKMFEKHSG